MSLRRRIGLISSLSIVLTLTLAYIHSVSSGEATATAKGPIETRGSDWTARVRLFDAAMEIAHKGVPIISTEALFWGRNWAYAGPNFKFVRSGDGQYQVVGDVSDLKLKLSGTLQSPAPNVIKMDLMFRAEQAMQGVIGGGWQWNFKLDSPSFDGRATDPERLPDGQGWTWRVGKGQAITLRFDGGAAKVYFEQGQKNTIRTFFFADRIEPGTHRFRVTLELPEGARLRPSAPERYGPTDTRTWFPGALAPDAAPVNLSFLNRADQPAGRRGFVRADGDRLVFADGSPARFWGGNLAAYAIFATPRPEVPRQARRMAKLGYNLMRIHHHDSDWVDPNIFGHQAKRTRRLDSKSLDTLDWWIKCLEDEGIYVWLDMHVGRVITPADGVTQGAEEIARNQGMLTAFSYYNAQLQALMKELQQGYLDHLNPYTKRKYKDDPAVIAVLITNENDLTNHGGNSMLPDHNNPVHNALWTKGYTAFARKHGLPADRVYQTWLPGPSKLYLAQAEHEFNQSMIADLRRIGVKAPIVTTNFWGENPILSLPPLTDGNLIDVHSYGGGEEFDKNAHYQGNYLGWIAMGQVYGKPLSVSEWNVAYPQADRFTAPLFVASIASLQGWDAAMIYNYSQTAFTPDPGPDTWSTYHDPALTAIMPAAALMYRQGHVSEAKKTYCLMLDSRSFFGRELTPDTSATVRTLAEQSKLTIGMPEVRDLPWLKPSRPSSDVILVTDPDRDFIPPDQSFVRSDTGELTRDWEKAIRTIDTPKTQAVAGWIGGKTLKTRDASFETRTKNAVVALTSVDNRPLAESRLILVTAVARAVPSPGGRPPFLSEPVWSKITLRTKTPDLELLAMGADGYDVGRPSLDRQGDVLTFQIPSGRGTHWYVLRTRAGTPASGAGAPRPQETSSKGDR